MSLKLTLTTATLILSTLVGSASAQDQVARSVKIAAGKATRLGVVASVTRECTPGPMPEVRVTTPPKNGTLTVRSGKTRAGGLKRCPNLEVPIQAMFYQPSPNSPGTDEAVYEIKRSDGRTTSVTTRIEVIKGQVPAPQVDENTEL